ncbi:MAG TPA: radical SAM protein, partial [Tepidisphaeraceae bacterium]
MPTNTAILSLLHESSGEHSATRTFRETPVLDWTLNRLFRANQLSQTIILCWDDQRPDVSPIASARGAQVHSQPRTPIPTLDAISAAQRWSDGWRGGLLATCHFDRGFHAPSIQQALHSEPGTRDSELLLLIDPSAALIDPALIDALIAHAGEFPNRELYFTQSAPGLAPVAIRPILLDRLAKTNSHPGRLLSYWPDTPGRDPMTTEMCLAVPPAIARSLHRFTLDSRRQIGRIAAATASLNGQLITSDAQRLVELLDVQAEPDRQPREVVLELTTRRSARPIFAPGTHLQLGRGDMSLETVDRILEQLTEIDDLRLTLAGAGDPLLHADFAQVLDRVAQANIPAVHVETDLFEIAPSVLERLVSSQIDILTLHLPAATVATYQRIMGVDGLAKVVENLKHLLSVRRSLPLIVPTFTKCRENLEEMEPWYDHWLRVLGTAVIVGPSDYAGQIPDTACADMSPSKRRPC